MTGTIIAGIFALMLSYAVLAGYASHYWLAYYLAISLITFALYGADKQAAMNYRWRVAEGKLLSLGLLGGWPGAQFGQQIFRHKTQKEGFLLFHWCSVALNVIGLYLLVNSRFLAFN